MTMNSILLGILFYILIAPVITLVHELGHAAAALLFSDKEVTIRLGRLATLGTKNAHRMVSWRVGRLRYVIRPLSGFVGFYTWNSQWATRLEKIVTALAGPVASLLLALLIWLVDTVLQPDLGAFDSLLRVAGGSSFLMFLFTIVPVQYPRWWMGAYAGTPSDGLRAYRLLRGTTA